MPQNRPNKGMRLERTKGTMLLNAAAQGRAGMDAQPETWMLWARSLE